MFCRCAPRWKGTIQTLRKTTGHTNRRCVRRQVVLRAAPPNLTGDRQNTAIRRPGPAILLCGWPVSGAAGQSMQQFRQLRAPSNSGEPVDPHENSNSAVRVAGFRRRKGCGGRYTVCCVASVRPRAARRGPPAGVGIPPPRIFRKSSLHHWVIWYSCTQVNRALYGAKLLSPKGETFIGIIC